MADTKDIFRGRVGGGSHWMWLQQDAKQVTRIEEELVKKSKKLLEQKEQDVRTHRMNVDRLERVYARTKDAADKAALDAANKDKLKAEKDLAAAKQTIHKNAARVAQIAEQNRYKKLTNREKFEYQKSVQEKLKIDKAALEEKKHAEEAAIQDLKNKRRSETDAVKIAALDKQIARKTKKTAKIENELKDLTSDEQQVEILISSLFSHIATRAELAKKATEDYTKAEETRAQAVAEAKAAWKDYYAAIAVGSTATAKEKYELEKLAEAREAEAEAANKAAKDALKRKDKASKEAAKEETEEEKRARRSRNIAAAANFASNQIDSALSNLYGQQGRMMGTLQGTNINWAKSVAHVSDTIGFSHIVSQQKVVEKMVQLVDSGVAYNLELRAFLAETSENIAHTFNAFDSNLLRLVRIQQSDSTAARLGLEAVLTKQFNEWFEDTGYLAQEVSDSIFESILDATATMSREDSLAFEYTVQKWLGSLYSLGMSSKGVQTIAEGINYLATGNVSALSNNSSLQTLFSLGAARTKKSYSEMLTGGFSPEETNDLLKSIVEVLSSIAEGTENRVTASAYAQLFDMSLTDLRTFASLSSDIDKIYNSNASYADFYDETSKQLSQISSRKNVSQWVDTVIENAMTGTAQNIGSNVATYGLWKALNTLQGLATIEIPGITVVGSGTTSAIDVLNLAKLGFTGIGLVGSLVEAIVAGGEGGKNLEAWDMRQTTSRGSTLKALTVGSGSGTSYSAQLSTMGGAGDIEAVSFESAQQTATDRTGITSEELQESKELPQQIFDVLAGDTTPTILSVLQEIDDRLDYGRVFYTAMMSEGTAGAASSVSNIHNLSTSIATAQSTTMSGQDSTASTSSSTVGTTGVNNVISGTNVTTSTTSPEMQELITAAVEQAIRNISGYSTGNGIPVTVTNLVVGGLL